MANKTKKAIREIPEQMVADACQILRNFCVYNHKGCGECMLKMTNGGCLIDSDFPERFEVWSKEYKNGK